MAKILTVDLTKCTGCDACELACSLRNVGEFNPSRSRIQIISSESDFFRIPIVCLQCFRPPCAEICPTGAITRDETTGIVRVSASGCNGCRMCEEACPFGAIFFSELEQKAVKCELCDGDPQCVAFCPTDALAFRESEAAMDDKRRGMAERLKEVYSQLGALDERVRNQ
ncbi:4Fe-4S dicluster domain-containing protein [Chloroflexota bacterium]